MREYPTDVIEKGRLNSDEFYSPPRSPFGAFRLRAPSGMLLRIISSDGTDEIPWEHVSVSTDTRCPTWDEMEWVRQQFWREDETVMQLHPPKTQYINKHPYCLHLWRPKFVEVPLPPLWAV